MAEYTTINHPVAGQVDIRTDALERMTPAELNDLLVKHVATQLKEEGIELSSFDAFTGQVAREITSTSRGIQERGAEFINDTLDTDLDERTTSYEDDFMSEVAFETNPTAAWSGLIAGAILDPVAFINPLRKAQRIKRIAGGAAVGGGAGFLTPTRDEFGESTAVTTTLGAGIGAILAAIDPRLVKLGDEIAQKLGYKTEKEMQDGFKNATEEEQRELARKAQEIVQEEQDALSRTAEQDAELERIRQVGDEMEAQRLELERIRNVGDEFKAQQDELERIRQVGKDADVERIKQIGRDAELERIRNVGDEFATSRYEADVQRIKDEVREETLAELEAKAKSTFGGDPKKVQQDVKKANNKLSYANAQLNKVRTGAKKVDEPTLIKLEDNVRKAQEEVDFLRNKRDVYKQRQADIKELVQVKKGTVTPAMKEKIDTRVADLVKPEPRTTAVKPEAPTRTLAAEDFTLPSRVQEPVTAQRTLQPQRATEQPTEQVPAQTPTTVESLQQPQFTGKSVGSGQRNILTLPTAAQEAATLDLRTKVVRDLPEPSPSVVAGRPDMTTREAKQQSYMTQAERGVDEDYFNTDAVEGQYTFKNLLDAAEDKQRFVEAEIDEGNYKDAADWVAREFENSDKVLSPATKIVAARIYAIASDNLVKLQDVFRQVEKSGRATAKDIEVLGEMQENSQLRKAMDVMRNLERIEAADKKNTSAALNAFKLANKMKKSQMQQLARARTISKLYFGVEC
jgi:hypothetical protein